MTIDGFWLQIIQSIQRGNTEKGRIVADLRPKHEAGIHTKRRVGKAVDAMRAVGLLTKQGGEYFLTDKALEQAQ